MVTDEERLRRRLWWLIAALHVAAAFLSKGYHHPDEYFQILEFARHKLLNTGGDELAWEFGARIRPWLQPALYAGIIRTLSAAGVDSPFSQTMVLRFLSSALGFASTVALAGAARRWVSGERARTWLVAALGLAWFMPYLHARTSSENLATSMMCLAVAALAGTDDPAASARRRAGFAALAGLAAGASFEARFQMGIMIVGVAAWLLHRRQWLVLVAALPALAAVIALGRIVDHWGYGDWTLAPLAYFRVNVVESKASSFGTQPWWWYFRKLVSETPPPVGPLLLVLVPIAWWRERRHLLTWATLPFFFAHVAIAHKELRFLFPMGPLVTVLLVSSFERLRLWQRALPRWAYVVAVLVALPNFAYLLMNCLKPVRGEVLVLESIWDNTREDRQLYVADASPFVYRELAFGFYESPHAHVHYIDDYAQLDRVLEDPAADKPVLLYMSTNWLPAEAERVAGRCHVLHRSFPIWVQRFNFKNWLQRTYQALLLECR